MINWLLLSIVFLIASCSKSPAPESCPFTWDLEKIGFLSDAGSGSDVIFLSETEFLVASLPSQGRPSAPLEIYSLKNGLFELDKEASRFLPITYHPRNIISEDLDNDGINEIVISDHGDDAPPFDGGTPIILRKSKGYWRPDPTVKSMGKAFTFNVAALPLEDGTKGIFRGNVGKHYPLFLKKKKNDWIDSSHLFPQELNSKLCYMSTQVADFDRDGSSDLYLGGCDLIKELPEQAHDRILTKKNGKWIFAKEDSVPARIKNATWATVAVKSFNLNNDNLPDLLLATHDHDFHNWQINALENKSTPGEFKFVNYPIPLKQEGNTDGFVYGIEDFNLKNSSQALMVEIRSVVRDNTKRFPKVNNRFMVKTKDGFTDFSSCLPDVLKVQKHTAKKFPGSREKLLMIPFLGNIYSLTVSDKKK